VPPRGVEALGEGVQQERHHHRRMVGRLPAHLPSYSASRQAQLVAHQMRRMVGPHESCSEGGYSQT
jgi:hypothetical protein